MHVGHADGLLVQGPFALGGRELRLWVCAGVSSGTSTFTGLMAFHHRIIVAPPRGKWPGLLESSTLTVRAPL